MNQQYVLKQPTLKQTVLKKLKFCTFLSSIFAIIFSAFFTAIALSNNVLPENFLSFYFSISLIPQYFIWFGVLPLSLFFSLRYEFELKPRDHSLPVSDNMFSTEMSEKKDAEKITADIVNLINFESVKTKKNINDACDEIVSELGNSKKETSELADEFRKYKNQTDNQIRDLKKRLSDSKKR